MKRFIECVEIEGRIYARTAKGGIVRLCSEPLSATDAQQEHARLFVLTWEKWANAKASQQAMKGQLWVTGSWKSRCASMAIAGRRAALRTRMGSQTKEEYCTNYWGTASTGAFKRMLQQGENRYRRSKNDKWKLWGNNRASAQRKRASAIEGYRKTLSRDD